MIKGKILKRSFIILFCLFLVTLIIWRVRNSIFITSPKIENFILISIDDLRADRLGCYGHDRDTSSSIDSLANQGAQFLNAFIPWPETLHSHASMLTSIYPSVLEFPLDPSIQTIASILKKHGYKTAAFTGGVYMSAEFGLLNGFEEYDDSVELLLRLKNKTKRWLRENQDQKFFLFLHTYYVHRPFRAPEEYFRKISDPDYTGPINNSGKSVGDFIEAANAGKIEVTPEDMQRILDIYDSQIMRIDERISQIVEALRSLDLINKTMLIITSDHGEQFYEYKYFGHASRMSPFADISTRVPLIIYCPILPQKGKVDLLVESIDISPTILDAAGIKIPKYFQGQSLFPLLSGKPRLSHKKKEVFYRNFYFMGLRTENLKLTIDLKSGKPRLYDLVNDPTEKEDIIEESSPSKVRALMKKINGFAKRNEDLRSKLNISSIRLPGQYLAGPFSFDEATVFLASFNDNTFRCKKENSQHADKFRDKDFHLEKGKYGEGLLLDPDEEINFPIKAPVLSDSGAIEFWLKLKRKESRNQNIFKIDLTGEGCSIFIQANVTWNSGEGIRRRVTFEFTRSDLEDPERDILFSTSYQWNTWHHILVAWESEEVFLFVDSSLVSRKKTYTFNFFGQGITDKIKISGENCVLDEFRISNVTRFYRPKKEERLEAEMLRKLKTLGYIK